MNTKLPSEAADLFKAQTDSGAKLPGKLVFKLEIPGRLPSWNDVLGMEQWARYKFKNELQLAFLSELRAFDDGFSTKTTSVKSSMSIAADTLASYMEMNREKRRLRLLKKKQAKASENLLV